MRGRWCKRGGGLLCTLPCHHSILLCLYTRFFKVSTRRLSKFTGETAGGRTISPTPGVALNLSLVSTASSDRLKRVTTSRKRLADRRALLMLLFFRAFFCSSCYKKAGECFILEVRESSDRQGMGDETGFPYQVNDNNAYQICFETLFLFFFKKADHHNETSAVFLLLKRLNKLKAYRRSTRYKGGASTKVQQCTAWTLHIFGCFVNVEGDVLNRIDWRRDSIFNTPGEKRLCDYGYFAPNK